MPAPSPHAQVLLDRLEGVVAINLEVRAVRDVMAGLRSLRCEGDLGGFDPLPGQDLMIPVPRGDGETRWRRYTVRAIDRAAGALELWITTDSDGPGAAWALASAPGTTFEAVGPRGKVHIHDDLPRHLFVVDASGLSAALAMSGSISPPSTQQVVALVEQLPDASALGAVGGGPGDASRAPVSFTRPDDLLAHLAHLVAAHEGASARFDPRSTAAYVFGEFAFTRLVKDRLVALGLPGPRVAAKAYWRAGQSNQDHGEPDKSPG